MVRPSRRGRFRALLASEDSIRTEDAEGVSWSRGVFTDTDALDQWKQPVRCATTASITIATALNNGDTLDGITLATGDRVLVKDQSTGSQNGIYIVGTTPERAADFDEDDEVLGALIYVIAGTVNGGKVFKVTNTSAVTVGTTAITIAEFTVAASFGTPANSYGTPAAGAASTAIRTDAVLVPPDRVVLSLVNMSGGSVAAGDVVILDTANDGAFTTTTTGQAETSVGIAQETIASNSTGRVLVAGFAGLVNVPSSMTRGRYLETHTVAKQATGSATRRAGSFGQFLTGGSTPTALLWGQTDQTASGGGSSLTVEEVDGSPTDSAVTKIVFPNGTLAIVSHVATYTPSGGASGALVLLEQHTASSSAQLDFTSFISSTYDDYEIRIVNVVPATNGANLNMQVGTGGTPTYDTTGANYSSQITGILNGGGGGSAVANPGIPNLANGMSNTASYGGASIVMHLSSPQSTTFRRNFHGTVTYVNSTPAVFSGLLGIQYTSNGTALTALKFLMSSGNIASGTIRIYGVTK